MNRERLDSQKLPKNWTWASVGDLAEKINPGFPCGKYNKAGIGVPHLRPMNITEKGLIDLSDLKYVEVSDYEPLMAGDVLFNNTNSPALLGKTALVRHNAGYAYSNHMTRIRLPQDLVNPSWVAYGIHSLFLTGHFRMNCAHHVNQASINAGFLSEKVFLPLPPLTEQHRIVAKIEELFTKLDAGIEALKKAKEQLKLYRKVVLEAAVTGELTREWREAHKEEIEPAPELLKRVLNEHQKKWEEQQLANMKAKGKTPKDDKWKAKYKEPKPPETSKLPELPEGWMWTNIGQLCESMRNGIYKPAKFYSDEGVACLRMYNIDKGRIIWKDIKRMSLTEEEVAEYQLLPGDLLVNRVNSRDLVGKSAPIPSAIERCVFESKNIRVRLLRPYINTYFVSYWFSTEAQDYFNRHSQQVVGMASISQPQIAGFSIPLPPTEEQDMIVDKVEMCLSNTNMLEQTLDDNIRFADQLRQSILKDAFAGKLVPHDSTDEPAEELLERIKAEKAEKQFRSKRAKKPKAKKGTKQLEFL